MEALSPELALVDAELAAAARAALAPAPDVFATLERSRANRDVVRRMRESFVAQEAAAAERVAARDRSSVRRRVAGLAFASTVAAGAIVTGALALGRDDVPEPRALAAPAPSTPPPQVATPRRSVGKAAVRRPAPAVKKAVRKTTPAVVAPAPRPKTRVVPERARPKATPVRQAPRTAVSMRPATPPVLSWPIARRATYYRVRVYRTTGQFLFEVWSDTTRLKVPSTWKNGSKKSRLTPGRYGWAVYPAFGDLGEPSSDAAAGTPLAGGHFTV